MTEQHPVSSPGQHPWPQQNPPPNGPTSATGDAFPEPGSFAGQPVPPSPPQPYGSQLYGGQAYGGQPYGGQPYAPQQPYGPNPYPQQQYPPPYGPLGAPAWRDPMPPAGTEYHRFLRTDRNRWWKGAVAIIGFVIGYLIINTVVGLVAMIFDVLTGRSSWEALSSGQVELTPALFLATNIGNALCIPLAMLTQWLIWGQPVRFLHSVSGSVRWRLMARSALIVVPLWLVYMGVSTFAFPELAGTDGTGPTGSFTAESVALLIIMLLTTPLQAAGEEYGARGLIMRAAGTYSASPLPGLVIATIVPSVVFMFAHGAGDPWLNVYYFTFGVAMSLLVWRTGGLEAACVVHVINNMLAFGVVILSGQEINLDRSAGTGGAFMLVPMGVLVIVTVVLCLLAKRWSVQRTYQPLDVRPTT